ncbi:MAG: hypothetical protein ACI8PW_000321 [Methylophilaceae bacterium]|jgi:hypothetical protein
MINSEHIAVYKKDPAIKIARHTNAMIDDFSEVWLKGLYRDQQASSHRVSIQYNVSELFKKLFFW